MKNKKSFLLCGLALLSLVFAMSCSNPASPEPQAEKVTITYVKGEGVTTAAPAKKTVEKGYKLTAADLPAITASEGYKDAKWYNGAKEAKANDVVNANITLISKATKKAVNPDKPEPKPEVPVNIIDFVKGKKFIDDTNSIYSYNVDGKSYTMTLNSDKEKIFSYAYTVDNKTKTITNTSENGYGNINKFTYTYAIVGDNIELTNGKVIAEDESLSTPKDFPVKMTLQPVVTITYSNDGKTETKDVRKDTVLTADYLPTLINQGFKFKGWYNGDVEVKAELTVSKDIVLTAKWEKLEGTLTKGPKDEPVYVATSEEDIAAIIKKADNTHEYIIELINDVKITSKELGINKNTCFYTGKYRLTLADGLGIGNLKFTGEVYVSKNYGIVFSGVTGSYTTEGTKVYTDYDYNGQIWGQTIVAEVDTLEKLKIALSNKTIEKVELTADIEINSKNDAIDITRKVTLDLNNKTITASADNTTNFFPIEVLNNNAEVTIKNGNLTHKAGLIITIANAKLSLEKITLTSDAQQACIQIYNNSTLSLNDSNIKGVVCLLGTKNTINVNSGTKMKATEESGAIQCMPPNYVEKFPQGATNSIINLNAGSTIESMNGTPDADAILITNSNKVNNNDASIIGKINSYN